MTIDKYKINLDITRNYLEMARSVFTAFENVPDKDKIDETKWAGLIFATTSVTVIYSYMSLEAFINYQLYRVWDNSHLAFISNERLKRKQTGNSINPLYPYFYDKYGHVDEFYKLKDTGIGDLGDRIKLLCRSFQINQIYDTEPSLWQAFKDLHKNARHFLIHPFPNPKEMNEIMTRLFNTQTGTYVAIAGSIITHFYKERGEEEPGWIYNNTAFKISSFEYIE
ncbi:MAG: hypothetical protein H8E14_12885 [Candidatus Marinimicrobia bacterium]|nr:hypothetical protein [Candidatus Neomarinimicrobiota bacterium]